MSQAWAAGLSCREGKGVLAGADCPLPNILRWADGRLVLAKHRYLDGYGIRLKMGLPDAY